MLDLDAYFKRIDYKGSRAPTLQVLSDLLFQHAISIPFENLDVLSDVEISLQLQDIFDKLVVRHRGGYCFEQNALLQYVLEQMGFRVQAWSARVRLNTVQGSVPGRTHLFLCVAIEQKRWMADVGIGGLTTAGTLDLERLDATQSTPHELRRIVRCSSDPFDTFLLQAELGDQWVDILEFTKEPMPLIDQQIANWWACTHPGSKFRTNLIVAVPRRDGSRVSLFNRELIHRKRGTVVERLEIDPRTQLEMILERYFGLPLPNGFKLGMFEPLPNDIS